MSQQYGSSFKRVMAFQLPIPFDFLKLDTFKEQKPVFRFKENLEAARLFIAQC